MLLNRANDWSSLVTFHNNCFVFHLYIICISSVFLSCVWSVQRANGQGWSRSVAAFSSFDAFEARKSQRAAAVLTLSSNIGLDMYTLFSNYIRFQSKTFLILLLLLIATFQFHVATQLGHKGSFSTGLHQTEIIDMYETNLNW